MTMCSDIEISTANKQQHIDNVVGQNFVQLMPGLSVSLSSAQDLGAADTKHIFPGDDQYIHINNVLAGKFEATVGNTLLQCECGDFNIGFSGGENFCAYHSNDFSNLEIMIKPEVLNELAGEELSGVDLGKSMSFFVKQSGPSRKVSTCANRIHKLIKDQEANPLLLHSATLDYLYWHLTALKSVDTSNQLPLREKKQLIAARDFLLSDLSCPPTISDVAKVVGLNQCKLKKGFKVLFNNTVYGCFQEERMHKAMNLLKDNNVTETAVSLGYSNVSHFSVAFRKQFGVLPKEARLNLAPSIVCG
ncbi:MULTISPECIES: AraC family transcriptional regulator [unclassified Pseudoalteromonas]|uniref:AraC family transcriptional regulator n=1 Tax=unclassified Pseudoalteromonas TaxID=194690 RepID=UPI000C7E18FA|nr:MULTISPECIES: AraC family transcriptional regulator [unclassified Pseudoalteromonas]AUJ72301.1 Regulatory protein PchR [Pseudoalteromonas sp. NC201]MCF2828545.1 AraC family transcriptional regulator [Pseudoalteromonas sp. OF5H-5]MCF2831180.1 AraC family transcriptional regulator [Pseudoalteromonas sp. DL2-H6]MCF2924851.1 AraC family transcriptional regulator [Pseudoalteromonas sp. DL2-H1]MCF7515646.1 AraC family transcriptional regulator [Pseudoalteromonas sp. L7]